jgi:hypothetical protein
MTVPSHTTEAVDGSVVPDRKLPLTSATNSRSPGMAAHLSIGTKNARANCRDRIMSTRALLRAP